MYATQSAGREAMAILAARLMGGGPLDTSTGTTTPAPAPAPAPAASKSTIPRTVPGVQPATAPNNPSPPQQSSQSAFNGASNRQSDRAKPEAVTSPSAAPSPPVKAPPSNDGPSLRGSMDQLAAAREFLTGATQGGSKSRGGSRARVLSKEPDYGPARGAYAQTSSPARSTRSSVASATSLSSYAPPVASPRPRLSSVTKASTATGGGLTQWQNLRGPVAAQPSLAAPAANATKTSTATQQSQSSDASASSPIKKENVGPAPVKTSIQASQPSLTPAVTVKKEDAPPAPTTRIVRDSQASTDNSNITKYAPAQMKEILNVLKDRANETPPPHFREKSVQKTEAPATAKASSVSQVADTITTISNEALQPAVNVAKSSGPPAPLQTTSASNATTPQPAANGVKDCAHSVPSHDTEKLPTPRITTHDETLLLELKAELTSIKQRVAGLESENFSLQGQVEKMNQAEERRKFLGTDNTAMAPYGINVKDANSNEIRIQVTKALKVGDVVRRIRVKADLSPGVSKNPRIAFKDEQLGHGMTMDEAGVVEGSTLLFTYSGP